MRVIAVALVAAFFFMAVPAEAQVVPHSLQVPCSGPDFLPDLLIRDYGESVTGQGVANGALVQLWHNPETGSWTILMVSPDGMVCALAGGDDWMRADVPPPAGL